MPSYPQAILLDGVTFQMFCEKHREIAEVCTMGDKLVFFLLALTGNLMYEITALVPRWFGIETAMKEEGQIMYQYQK